MVLDSKRCEPLESLVHFHCCVVYIAGDENGPYFFLDSNAEKNDVASAVDNDEVSYCSVGANVLDVH